VSTNSTSTFATDLKSSQQGENELAVRFTSKGWETTSTQQQGAFSQYDLTVTKKDITYTVEYKHDIKSATTGNACVELSKTINGVKKPSGLSATSAQYYVYKFGIDDTYYGISVRSLLSFIKNNKCCLTRVSGGDGGRSNLVLIPLEDFKKVMRPILY